MFLRARIGYHPPMRSLLVVVPVVAAAVLACNHSVGGPVPAPAPPLAAPAPPPRPVASPVVAATPAPAPAPAPTPLRSARTNAGRLVATVPTRPPRPTAETGNNDGGSQGMACIEGRCAAGLKCITYYGIAGPRGPAFTSCEISCAGGGRCPKDQHCIVIADGPGNVCRPLREGDGEGPPPPPRPTQPSAPVE